MGVPQLGADWRTRRELLVWVQVCNEGWSIAKVCRHHGMTTAQVNEAIAMHGRYLRRCYGMPVPNTVVKIRAWLGKA